MLKVSWKSKICLFTEISSQFYCTEKELSPSVEQAL